MATRTPTKAETPEETPEPTPETPPEAPAANEGLMTKIGDMIDEKVKQALDGLKEVTGKGQGRRTYRDEEDEMNDLVTSKVKDLLAAEKAQGEKHPEPDASTKAPPEPVPAQPSGRRVEKLMGW
jgi:hypothetical protein